MTASRLCTFVLVTGALMVGTIAEAQQPSQSEKSTTGAAPSSAAPASRPAKSAAAAQKPVDSNAQLIKDARNAGFKPEMIRGARMFCRTAIELGSSFPVRTCYDADHVKIKIQQYQEERNQLEQMHSTGLKSG
jgi:hypothetical protein